MRGFLLILAVCILQSHAFFGWNYRSRYAAQAELPADWETVWEQVGELVETPPSQKLLVEWPNNVNVQPNDTISVGWMEGPKKSLRISPLNPTSGVKELVLPLGWKPPQAHNDTFRMMFQY